MTVSRAADHTADESQRAGKWAVRLLNTLCEGSFAERVNLYAAACLMAAGIRLCELADPDAERALRHGDAALTIDQLQTIADRLGMMPEELVAAVTR